VANPRRRRFAQADLPLAAGVIEGTLIERRMPKVVANPFLFEAGKGVRYVCHIPV